ncbi:hypothetical protein O9X98_08510 [Agrobacterium salinitolerans]|nr:hypothetical protein [Agrobacterium salinitolerans]
MTNIANVSISANLESTKRELIETGRAFTVANLASLVEHDVQPVLGGGEMTDFMYRGAKDGVLWFTANLSIPWFSPRMRDDYIKGIVTDHENPPALKSEYLRALDEASDRFNRSTKSTISVDGITLLGVWWKRSTIDIARPHEERILAVKERLASLAPEEIAALTYMQVSDRAMVPTGIRTEEGELYAVLTLDDEGRCVHVAEPSEHSDAFILMRGQGLDPQLSASAAFR